LAIFNPEAVETIFSGDKKIEGRFSQIKIAPYGKVSAGDVVLIKLPGEKIVGQFLVDIVIYFDHPTLQELADLKKKSQKNVAAGKAEALAEIHKLEKRIEELKKKTYGLAAASEDAWKITKQGVDTAWKGLRDSARKALAKFS